MTTTARARQILHKALALMETDLARLQPGKAKKPLDREQVNTLTTYARALTQVIAVNVNRNRVSPTPAFDEDVSSLLQQASKIPELRAMLAPKKPKPNVPPQ